MLKTSLSEKARLALHADAGTGFDERHKHSHCCCHYDYGLLELNSDHC